MIEAYRLCRSRYDASSGKGAALHGGRWNPAGREVVYAANSRALAALEILVNYAVVPQDFALTQILIPSETVRSVSLDHLPTDWNAEEPIPETAAIGEAWLQAKASAVLAVPSSIIPEESNYLINVRHPNFGRITFRPAALFRFDRRLVE